MTVNIPKRVIDYFKTADVMLAAVNGIAQYMNLSSLRGVSASISGEVFSPIEIDEENLSDAALKNEKLFALLAIYAMGVGE